MAWRRLRCACCCLSDLPPPGELWHGGLGSYTNGGLGLLHKQAIYKSNEYGVGSDSGSRNKGSRGVLA